MIKQPKKTDKEFYNSLREYSTLCYRGEGQALFLVSKKYHGSAACVLLLCLAYGVLIWFIFNFNHFKR